MIRFTKGAQDRAEQLRPPTITEVAKRANVSQAAASYALSGPSPRISEATRARVLKAARELGYQPNLLARGLKAKSTGLLGIIVRDAYAPMATEVYRALLRNGPRYGYDIVLTDAGNDVETLMRIAAVMKSRLCDGLILIGDLPHQHIPWHSYRHLGVPTVSLLQDERQDIPGLQVVVDNEAAVASVVDHLYNLGHRRIAYVGTDTLPGVRRRASFFKSTMRARGLPVSRGTCTVTDFSASGGAEAFLSLISLRNPPTAIVACADTMATGVLLEASRLGILIPQEISLVGFDDTPVASVLHPALTTVRQPVQEMVHAALTWFRDNKQVPSPPSSTVLLHAQLVVRRSTGVPRDQDTLISRKTAPASCKTPAAKAVDLNGAPSITTPLVAPGA